MVSQIRVLPVRSAHFFCIKGVLSDDSLHRSSWRPVEVFRCVSLNRTELYDRDVTRSRGPEPVDVRFRNQVVRFDAGESTGGNTGDVEIEVDRDPARAEP